MAIDTAAKRKSAINVALHFARPGAIPDASDLEAPQRLHVQALYAGIASSAAADDGRMYAPMIAGLGHMMVR
jgi:hypothetical protein